MTEHRRILRFTGKTEENIPEEVEEVEVADEYEDDEIEEEDEVFEKAKA